METQQILPSPKTSSIERKTSELVFEQLVNETIYDVFSSLGVLHREAVYDYIEKKYRLKRNEFATRISDFSEAIEEVFGAAADLLEIQMMRELFRKVPEFKYWPEETLTFADYVAALGRFISAC